MHAVVNIIVIIISAIFIISIINYCYYYTSSCFTLSSPFRTFCRSVAHATFFCFTVVLCYFILIFVEEILSAVVRIVIHIMILPTNCSISLFLYLVFIYVYFYFILFYWYCLHDNLIFSNTDLHHH